MRLDPGQAIEVQGDVDDGFGGAWSVGRVLQLQNGTVHVQYDEFLDDDGSQLVESVKSSRVRPRLTDDSSLVPITERYCGEAMDTWAKDCWWEGHVYEVFNDRLTVLFPGSNEEPYIVYPVGKAPHQEGTDDTPYRIRTTKRWVDQAERWESVPPKMFPGSRDHRSPKGTIPTTRDTAMKGGVQVDGQLEQFSRQVSNNWGNKTSQYPPEKDAMITNQSPYLDPDSLSTRLPPQELEAVPAQQPPHVSQSGAGTTKACDKSSKTLKVHLGSNPQVVRGRKRSHADAPGSGVPSKVATAITVITSGDARGQRVDTTGIWQSMTAEPVGPAASGKIEGRGLAAAAGSLHRAVIASKSAAGKAVPSRVEHSELPRQHQSGPPNSLAAGEANGLPKQLVSAVAASHLQQPCSASTLAENLASQQASMTVSKTSKIVAPKVHEQTVASKEPLPSRATKFGVEILHLRKHFNFFTDAEVDKIKEVIRKGETSAASLKEALPHRSCESLLAYTKSHKKELKTLAPKLLQQGRPADKASAEVNGGRQKKKCSQTIEHQFEMPARQKSKRLEPSASEEEIGAHSVSKIIAPPPKARPQAVSSAPDQGLPPPAQLAAAADNTAATCAKHQDIQLPKRSSGSTHIGGLVTLPSAPPSGQFTHLMEGFDRRKGMSKEVTNTLHLAKVMSSNSKEPPSRKPAAGDAVEGNCILSMHHASSSQAAGQSKMLLIPVEALAVNHTVPGSLVPQPPAPASSRPPQPLPVLPQVVANGQSAWQKTSQDASGRGEIIIPPLPLNDPPAKPVAVMHDLGKRTELSHMLAVPCPEPQQLLQSLPSYEDAAVPTPPAIPLGETLSLKALQAKAIQDMMRAARWLLACETQGCSNLETNRPFSCHPFYRRSFDGHHPLLMSDHLCLKQEVHLASTLKKTRRASLQSWGSNRDRPNKNASAMWHLTGVGLAG